MARRLKLTAVVCAAVLGLAACSSGGTEESPPADPPEQQTSTEEPSGEESSDNGENADVQAEIDEAAGDDAQEVDIDDELDVIASRESAAGDGHTKAELELNMVRASGELLTVMFTVRNIGEEDGWKIGDNFDSGERTLPLDSDGVNGDAAGEAELDDLSVQTTDGVTVTDNVNGQVYHAAYDSSGRCLCSSGLNGVILWSDEAIVLSTRFAAPPEDVDTVTVQIPNFGTFEDVPVER